MDVLVNVITQSFGAWLLWSIGAFLLGLFLGWWLWYKYRQLYADLEAEREREHTRFVELETAHASLKYKHDELEKDKQALRASLNKSEGDKVMLQGLLDECRGAQNTGIASMAAAAAAPAVFGGSSDEGDGGGYSAIFPSDNLQIVEGIGPKIQGLLNTAGIKTWQDLANAGEPRLQKILDDAGPRYRIHSPARWSAEARLAAAGEWDKLIHFQKNEDPSGPESPSKVEKLAAKTLGFSSNKPDDLKVVEGIGPKIEQLLKDAGINNWTDLAKASVEKLNAIMAEAGDRYRLASPDTWPKQAELASAGKWSELKKYQDFLQGGKSPGK